MATVTALLVDLVLFGLVIYRQVSVRPVRASRLWLILAAVGVVELASYGQHNKLAPLAVAALAGSLVVGAVLGGVRAVTVRIWYRDGVPVRQGTWVTVLLWLVSVGIHLGAGALLSGPTRTLLEVGTLLYLGVTLGTQQLVIGAQARRIGSVEPAGAPQRAGAA